MDPTKPVTNCPSLSQLGVLSSPLFENDDAFFQTIEENLIDLLPENGDIGAGWVCNITERLSPTFKPVLPLPAPLAVVEKKEPPLKIPDILLSRLPFPYPPIRRFETLFTLTPKALESLQKENLNDAKKEIDHTCYTLSLQLVSIRSEFPPAREKDIALSSFFYYLSSALDYLMRNDRAEDNLFDESLKLALDNHFIVKNYLDTYNRIEQITPILERFIDIITNIRTKTMESEELSIKRVKR